MLIFNQNKAQYNGSSPTEITQSGCKDSNIFFICSIKLYLTAILLLFFFTPCHYREKGVFLKDKIIVRQQYL